MKIIIESNGRTTITATSKKDSQILTEWVKKMGEAAEKNIQLSNNK
jgi:hypothetical protein